MTWDTSISVLPVLVFSLVMLRCILVGAAEKGITKRGNRWMVVYGIIFPAWLVSMALTMVARKDWAVAAAQIAAMVVLLPVQARSFVNRQRAIMRTRDQESQ